MTGGGLSSARTPTPSVSGLRAFRSHTFLGTCNVLLTLPSHRLRLLVLTHLLGASLGEHVTLERRCRVTGRGRLVIGAGTNINRGVLLDARGGLYIGSHVNISQDVAVLTAQHDVDSPGFTATDAPCLIGDRVWLSTRAMVLPGSTIGDGALVAAGAVIKGEVAPSSIVGGVPARLLGMRAADAQSALPVYRRWFH